MGIGTGTMQLLTKMAQDGLFEGKERSIIELGSQDLHSYAKNGGALR